jgi:magnesium and cobalt transporter
VTFEILEAGPRRIHTVRILKPRALPAPDAPLLLAAPNTEIPDKEEEAGRRANGIQGAKAA